jgi:hypothetical protein
MSLMRGFTPVIRAIPACIRQNLKNKGFAQYLQPCANIAQRRRLDIRFAHAKVSFGNS